jgi:hypothetical protein
MHRIPAPPLVITGRATSTTASSWAWAHGPAGVITTVGAGIALSLPGAEDITVASWAITEMPAPVPPSRITINLTPRPRITANLIPRPITANPTLLLTRRLTPPPPRRMVGNLTVVAGNLMVGVENTTSQ